MPTEASGFFQVTFPYVILSGLITGELGGRLNFALWGVMNCPFPWFFGLPEPTKDSPRGTAAKMAAPPAEPIHRNRPRMGLNLEQI